MCSINHSSAVSTKKVSPNSFHFSDFHAHFDRQAVRPSLEFTFTLLSRAHLANTHHVAISIIIFCNVGMSFNIEKICDFIFEKIYDSFIILFIELSFRHLLN